MPASPCTRVALVTLACACGAGDMSRASDTVYMPSTTAASSTGDESSGATASTSPTASSTTLDESSGTVSAESVGPDSSASATTDASADGSPTTSDDAESSGGASVCDGIAGEELIPPDSCDGPAGNTSTEVPSNGLFSTSWFGCYLGDDGEIVQDPGDNCEFACGPQGLCDDGQSGPECEAGLQWFAADADRYGCGGRIRVTNCDNGNAVVLVTLDRGPNCAVEMDCETPVLDMSHDAMDYLFDGGEYGGCDHVTVVVEPVDESTPLGPV